SLNQQYEPKPLRHHLPGRCAYYAQRPLPLTREFGPASVRRRRRRRHHQLNPSHMSDRASVHRVVEWNTPARPAKLRRRKPLTFHPPTPEDGDRDVDQPERVNEAQTAKATDSIATSCRHPTCSAWKIALRAGCRSQAVPPY